MSKALRSIERILAVQKQKLRLAEWTLFDVQRRQAALLENQKALGRLLDMDETTGTAFARLAARTGRRAGVAASRLEQAEAVAKHQMHHEYRQFKLSERLWRDRRQDDARLQEKRLLDDIVDRLRSTEE